MPLRTAKFITRAMLRAAPTTLFVFGDNMARAGNGGQAYEMRGEPNAVGIPTKWRPSMHEDAFFCDRDLPKVLDVVVPIWERLTHHLAAGGEIIWPEDGIGTGRAQLKERAPMIYGIFLLMYVALSSIDKQEAK